MRRFSRSYAISSWDRFVEVLGFMLETVSYVGMMLMSMTAIDIRSTTMMDCPARHLHRLEANNMILQRSREHPSCPDLSTKGQYRNITDERGSLVRASIALELEVYAKT